MRTGKKSYNISITQGTQKHVPVFKMAQCWSLFLGRKFYPHTPTHHSFNVSLLSPPLLGIRHTTLYTPLQTNPEVHAAFYTMTARANSCGQKGLAVVLTTHSQSSKRLRLSRGFTINHSMC